MLIAVLLTIIGFLLCPLIVLLILGIEVYKLKRQLQEANKTLSKEELDKLIETQAVYIKNVVTKLCNNLAKS